LKTGKQSLYIKGNHLGSYLITWVILQWPVKKMYKKIIKILLINIMVFVVIVSVTELIFGDWFLKSVCSEGIGRDHFIYCYNEDTYYNYSPEIVKILYLHPPDGRERIYNFINKSAIRVENFDQIHQETKFDEYDVINIGDSFLQADEINFNETLSYIFSRRSGVSALQIGYGSWAPITEYNFIRGKKLKPGVLVNLFVFMNDFTKTDYRSNIRYHTSFKNKLIDGKIKFIVKVKEKERGEKSTISHNWINYFVQRSYFMREIIYIYQQSKLKKKQNQSKYDSLNGDFSLLSSDLGMLNEITNKNINPRAKDYVEFSFSSSCWPDETISAVDNAISDIENIVEFVETAGGRVNVFLIPAGFSFANEHMVGKKHYNISPGTTITTDGLAEYLRKNLSTHFVSLEKVIDTLKKDNITEKWYFPADGHWNKHAHNQLGIWLANFHASTMH